MRYLLPLFLLVSGCASFHQPEPPAAPRARLGEEFSLALGDSIPLDGTEYTVVFRKVLDDSRCAVGHTCVWEGNARIEILVEPMEEPVEVNSSPRIPTRRNGSGLTIELHRLEPAPRADEPTSGYVATLIVRKP